MTLCDMDTENSFLATSERFFQVEPFFSIPSFHCNVQVSLNPGGRGNAANEIIVITFCKYLCEHTHGYGRYTPEVIVRSLEFVCQTAAIANHTHRCGSLGGASASGC